MSANVSTMSAKFLLSYNSMSEHRVNPFKVRGHPDREFTSFNEALWAMREYYGGQDVNNPRFQHWKQCMFIVYVSVMKDLLEVNPELREEFGAWVKDQIERGLGDGLRVRVVEWVIMVGSGLV